jgi:hypothetical protein
MAETVTLTLPESVAQSAHLVAVRTDRRVEDVLVEWLDRAAAEVPVESLPDEQVLALRDLQMSSEQQDELGDLLARQREGTLDAAGRARLDALMDTYRRGLMRKAKALQVAVARGLQPPLDAA